MIEKYLKELEDTWDMTTEELNHIKLLMCYFGLDVIHDTKLQEFCGEYIDEYKDSI